MLNMLRSVRMLGMRNVENVERHWDVANDENVWDADIADDVEKVENGESVGVRI